MLVRIMGALFAPKYPLFYAGRHRAPCLLRLGSSKALGDRVDQPV